MQPTLSVHLLPTQVDPTELADGTVVVIDVLRATTTITAALAAGAAGIIPFAKVDAARQRAAEFSGTVLLGGERHGTRIDGFDLGNSPREYTPKAVQGQTILFTTTNGTRALDVCQQAEKILLAGFVNLAAIASQVATASRLHLLCAGTDGEISQEDTLLAGALVNALSKRPGAPFTGNKRAKLARQAWCSCGQGPNSLESLLRAGRGGQNLIRLGLDADIHFCAALDRFDVVPSLDLQSGRITTA